MTCYDIQRRHPQYPDHMQALVRTLISSLPLVAVPAVAAVETGITSVGPAVFLFTVAIALLMTLVLRSIISHAMRYAVIRMGRVRIRRALAKRGKHVMSDFMLPGAYGGLAHIDYAVMTAGGILCIRAVHSSGVVFGGDEEAQWTHVDGPTRRRFLNPLIQNEGRRRAIEAAVPDVPVANLVIFTGRVDFSSPPPANVIRLAQFDSFVAKFVFGPSKVDDWDAVWMSLKAAALTDDATRRDFAAQVGFS